MKWLKNILLKSKKRQRQNRIELKGSFGIFYYACHFHNSQNSIFTLQFKFLERKNFKPTAVILFCLGITCIQYILQKTKASTVANTCNSKERVHHMIITSTNPMCHSRHFNLIFRTELSFIRVYISAFLIWFQNNVFKIAETAQISECLFSRVTISFTDIRQQ